MGVLDDLLGAAMRGAAGGAGLGGSPQAGAAAPSGSGGGLSPMLIMQIVSMLMNKQGGLGGLTNAFNSAGLGDIIKSWVSTGQNLPISPDQVTKVLGSGMVGQIASQLGVNSGQAGDLLSKVLPHVVDQLTPQGQVQPGLQSSGDLLNSAIGALAGKLFSQR